MSMLLAVTDLVLRLVRRRWPDAMESPSGIGVAHRRLVVVDTLPLFLIDLREEDVFVFSETGKMGQFTLGDPDFTTRIEEFVLGEDQMNVLDALVVAIVENSERLYPGCRLEVISHNYDSCVLRRDQHYLGSIIAESGGTFKAFRNCMSGPNSGVLRFSVAEPDSVAVLLRFLEHV